MDIITPPISSDEMSSFSQNIINEDSSNNEEELKKIKKLVDEQKKNGHKYPLIACFFLIFYNEGKYTLTKKRIHSLMEAEAINNKNKILSSSTQRYCIIDKKNYKLKIKDILKKQKWFTKKRNELGEIEYTLNPGVVAKITPKIISYFKAINKNESKFQTKEETIMDEIESEYLYEINNDNIIQDNMNINETKKSEDKNKTPGKKKVNEKRNYRRRKNKRKNRKKNKKIKKPKKNNISEIVNYDIIIDKNSKLENLSFDENIQINNKKDLGLEEDLKSENNAIQYLNKKRKLNQLGTENNIVIKKNKKDNESYFFSDNTDEVDEKTKEDTINNENQSPISEEEKIALLNNKIEAIINMGEIFIQLINNNELSNLIYLNIHSTKKDIEKNEKEMQSDKLLLEQLCNTEERINSVDNKALEKNINKIKSIFKDFMKTIKLLSIYKKKIEKYKNTEDIKEVINSYHQIYTKCSKILEQLMSNISSTYKDCGDFGEFLNILMIDEKIQKYLNVNNIIEIKDLENLFKNMLNSTMITDDLIMNDINNANNNLAKKGNKIDSNVENTLSSDINNN